MIYELGDGTWRGRTEGATGWFPRPEDLQDLMMACLCGLANESQYAGDAQLVSAERDLRLLAQLEQRLETYGWDRPRVEAAVLRACVRANALMDRQRAAVEA